MSTSPRSSIESWILQVESASTPGRRKRSQPSDPPSNVTRPARKRRPLRALSTNPAMPRSRTPAKPRGRGRGRRRADEEPGDKPDADVDATPRAARMRVGTPPSLPAPGSSAYGASPDRSLTSRASTKRSARSISPVKGLVDLTSSASFVHIALDDVLDHAESVLGKPAFDLYCRLAAHSAGASVIPRLVKAEIESSIRGRLLGLADHNFFDDVRPEHSVWDEYRSLQRVVRSAREFTADQDYEPAWNDQVHSRVLETALLGQESVWFRNVTKADISPKDLIPRHSLGGDLQSKMVDYAIYLEQTEDMRDRARQALTREAHSRSPTDVPWSVNHTTYPPLRLRPIAVSIETKTPSGKYDEAVAQLGVWGAAHLARLNRLVPPGTPLPTLPLVLASGTEWDLFFISLDTTAGKNKIFGSFRLGDTASLLGVYRLLRSVRFLADWADSTLRKWWDSVLSAD